MSPVIISEPHDKVPLSASELREFDIDNILEVVFLSDVGPDSLDVRLSLVEGDNEGSVTVEIMNGDTVSSTAGNVDFNKLDADGTCLEGGVQIKSAYFSTDYQGLGLGFTAYQLITKHHLLVSDTTQTHDGSAFWKFKLGDHDEIEINIVVTPSEGQPFTVCDEESSQPVIYHYTKEELEPMIWGLEFPNDEPHPGINASPTLRREDVVLVAIRRT